MDKLIPLLNEKTGKEWVLETSAFGEDWLFLKGHPEVIIKEEKLISKKFGFIKWLVDNDKIDRDKGLKENGLFRMYFYDLEYVKNYDRLVMWLSVEDEPIQFLISILK